MNRPALLSALLLISAATASAGHVAPKGSLKPSTHAAGANFQLSGDAATAGVQLGEVIHGPFLRSPAPRTPVLGGSSLHGPIGSTGRTGYFASPKAAAHAGRPTAGLTLTETTGSRGDGLDDDNEGTMPADAAKFTPVPMAGIWTSTVADPVPGSEIGQIARPINPPGTGDEDRSPLTVPLPSGALMGLLGLSGLAAVSRIRSVTAA